MKKTFNELFNEFFDRKNIKPTDKLTDTAKEEAKKIIDLLTNFQDVENIDESIEKEIDATLGKPDKIEFYNEGEMFFEKRTWYTENGDLVKLIVSDEPTLAITPPVEENLQKQLDEAIALEDYEKAALIRDRMKPEKKTRKKLK